MFNKIRNLFSNKREQSEYLKFEDGNVVSVDKVNKLNKSDKAPRLNIQKDNNKPIEGLNSPSKISKDLRLTKTSSDIEPTTDMRKKLFDRILIYVILAFIVTLAIYLFDLSKIFMNKTNDYMTTGKITEVPQISNTDDNIGQHTDKSTLNNKQLEVIQQPSKTNNKLMDLLQLIVQSNSTIQNNYQKAKMEVVYYADSKSTQYILNSTLSKIKRNTEQSYSNFLQYEPDFTKTEMKTLYDIQVERLNNLNGLITETEKIEGRSETVSVVNTYINKENELVRKQIDSFIDILKQNDIPYSNENGNISYTIK